MERITLNIIPKGITPVCHASQFDIGRVIRCDIMDDLQGYVFSDETVELRVRKPDDNVVTASVDVVSGDTFVLIETTEQMTACDGVNKCELRIMKGDVRIGSLNFDMKVEVDPLKDGIESETEIHNLETQIRDIDEEIVPDMVAEEVARQYTGDVIFDDEPTENHGDGYAVKSAGLKAYIPKIIDALDDVEIENPTSNQALVWDAENNKWTNGEVSTVGSIDDLNDVDTTGKASGDSLRYDGNEWVAKPTTIEMTQAEYNAIVDFTPYANTHIVITDAPNLNPTASDIEYSSGVTVADKLDDLATASGTATAQSGVTIGSKNLVYKQGIFCYICLVLSITSNISANDNLVKLPFAINTNQYILARKDDGTTVMLSGNGEYIKTEFAISSGTIIRIGATTLAV